MQNKIYDIISLNGQLYMVDKELPKMYEYFIVGDKLCQRGEDDKYMFQQCLRDTNGGAYNPYKCKRILASSDSSLGLPLIEDLDYEFYVPLKGHGDNYLISNFGNIYSLITKKNLKIQNSGLYPSYWLKDDSEKSKFTIHRLLAQTFIPNPENLPEVNHKDNDSQNYKLKNLEWVSRRENLSHQERLSNQSGYTGVVWYKKLGKWAARMGVGKKKKFLGSFDTEEQASEAYQKALKDNNLKNKYL